MTVIQRTVLMLAAVIVAQAASDPAVSQADEEVRLFHNRERSFNVHIPAKSKTSKSLPLVIALHGGGGSAEGMRRGSMLSEFADQEGFILVFPQGTGPHKRKLLTWNAGPCCGTAVTENVDDVGFIAKLIDHMTKEYFVDPTRVYVTGISNGALMANRLACELSDKVAAVALVAAPGQPISCKPTRPVPILQIQGMADKCAPYHGGSCRGCFTEFSRSIGIPMKDNTSDCRSIEEYIGQWKRINGCRGQSSISYKNGGASCRTFDNCNASVHVALCTDERGGHTWPGGARTPKICHRRPNGLVCRKWKKIVGEISSDLNANQLIWNFFKRFHLKSPTSSRSG